MKPVFIIAARRTAVAPRNGAFRDVEVKDLASAVVRALLDDCAIRQDVIDYCIFGNALYGGGNPARVVALAAGLPVRVSAISIDTQCCAGLDAIAIGASLIAAGRAQAVIAGGVESYSRSPLRARRPAASGRELEFYDRPPFTPWPDADPEMISAAAALAHEMQLSRDRQDGFAIESHAKAFANRALLMRECVPVADVSCDAFTRNLTPETCRRLPLVAGNATTGMTSATIAVEADAAAAVLLVGESLLDQMQCDAAPVRYLSGISRGTDPVQPAIAPIAVACELLANEGLSIRDLAAVEIMEAFAVQAIAFADAVDLRKDQINRCGGALARGHPIGASGAILAVRLFYELQREGQGALGLAAIAAAGGLGSAMLLSRS